MHSDRAPVVPPNRERAVFLPTVGQRYATLSREMVYELPADSGEVCALKQSTIENALRDQPLLKGLIAIEAGFSSSAGAGAWARNDSAFTLAYCVRGTGWCELCGRPQMIREGDLLLLGPGKPCRCAARPAGPWSFHWVKALGTLLPEYFHQLGASDQPLLRVGEDPQLVRLFHEIRQSLHRAPAYPALLQAAHGLGYLMALLIGKRHQSQNEDPDTARKVAAAIIYMSEHLDQPVRVSALARSANLSQAYFTEIFKSQAGCSPRDYLRLLRIHRACQLLQSTGLNIKEIATRTGYQDPFHFSRQFKAFQGKSPTEYRSDQ